MNKLNYIMFISALIFISCVNENYDLCPDYGKYKVLFFDMNNAKTAKDYNVFIVDNESLNSGSRILSEYIRPADTSLLKSDKILKLYPGDYKFKALLSANQMICLSKKVQLKNNSPYLFADTSKAVIKKSSNDVNLRFSLANSLIQIKCIINNEYSSRYVISNVVLSCPDDNDVYLDLLSGICNYSQAVTDFYDEALYSIAQDLFYFYCVPVIKSNYLNFKFSIKDNEEETENTLFCRVFLNTDISQGKVYQFRFNVTPFEIQYINTSIIEWDEKTNINIPVN